MKLFLDTNVYLSFYHYTSNDLDELNKLVVLIKADSCLLYTTTQLLDEFKRNREGKIFEALKNYKSPKLAPEFPRFCQDYPEFAEMQDLQKRFAKAHDEILKKIYSDVKASNLKADKVINLLFRKAKLIEVNDRILSGAIKRTDVGNPPGKNGSLGDAIHWECLLSEIGENEELHFISEDSDFASPLDNNKICEFLDDEWRKRNKTTLHFYNKLSIFFKEQYPDISIKSSIELDKEFLIRKLSASTSFAATHNLIADLGQYSDFTIEQINAILYIAATNDQVSWIINDEDVNQFIHSLILDKDESLNQDYLYWFYAHDDRTNANVPDDGIPF